MSAVYISRNLTRLDDNCFFACRALRFVAFDGGSNLRGIGPSAFHSYDSLRSIAIPSSVCLLERICFGGCASLQSATFERPSILATIEETR
jgi:hypothetical protein